MSSRGGKQPRGGKEASGYQPGRAPYQQGRGGRGGRNTNREFNENPKSQRQAQPAPSKAEQQFDKLFGGKQEEAKKAPAKAPTKTQGPPVGGPGPQIDDAIVFDDDAIVMDDDAIVIEDDNGDHKLTEAEKKVLETKQSKPLWKDERVRFSKDQLLKAFKKAADIDFQLLVKDYMEMFDVFNQTA